MSLENPQFLQKKYNLQNSPEVESAARRTNVRAEDNNDIEEVSTKPADRIQNYLDRFQEIIDRPNEAKRERGLEALKLVLHDKFVIKPEEVPESAFLLEQRIARELGYGTVEITDQFRLEKTNEIRSNQIASLDKWIDYLMKPDALYPDWAKYWAFRSVLEMGKFEKSIDAQGREDGSFKKRTRDTVASFPPLNVRALSLAIQTVSDKLEQLKKPKTERRQTPNPSARLTDEEFQKILENENFSKLYAQLLIEIPAYSQDGLRETRGKWVTYPKGSDAGELVKSLDGHPLEWCTAAYDTAKRQLQAGDFLVYYSLDQDGEARIPRVAIRMEDKKIAEVRGIAPEQNIDPYISGVISEKLKEFGTDGVLYEKKSRDMKMLTEIEEKTKMGEQLSDKEIRFLYQVDDQIQGFGYESDPRIRELLSRRDRIMDAPAVLDCRANEIASSIEELTNKTRVYIGPIVPKLFESLPILCKHVFTKFPHEEVKMFDLDLGLDRDKEELMSEFWAGLHGRENIYYDPDLITYIESDDFQLTTTPDIYEFVALTPSQLGMPYELNRLDRENPVLPAIIDHAHKLGLTICDQEAAVRMIGQLKDDQLPRDYIVATEPIMTNMYFANFTASDDSNDSILKFVKDQYLNIYSTPIVFRVTKHENEHES